MEKESFRGISKARYEKSRVAVERLLSGSGELTSYKKQDAQKIYDNFEEKENLLKNAENTKKCIEESIMKLENYICDKNKNIEEYQKIIRDLTSKIAREDDNQRQKDSLLKQYQDERNNLNKRAQEKTSQLDLWQKKMRKLEVTYNQRRSERDRAHTDKLYQENQAKNELTNLEHEKSKKEDLLQKAEEKLNQQKSANQSQTDDIHMKEKAVDDKERQITEFKDKIQSLNDKKTKIVGEIDAFNTTIKKLTAEINKAEKSNISITQLYTQGISDSQFSRDRKLQLLKGCESIELSVLQTLQTRDTDLKKLYSQIPLQTGESNPMANSLERVKEFISHTQAGWDKADQGYQTRMQAKMNLAQSLKFDLKGTDDQEEVSPFTTENKRNYHTMQSEINTLYKELIKIDKKFYSTIDTWKKTVSDYSSNDVYEADVIKEDINDGLKCREREIEILKKIGKKIDELTQSKSLEYNKGYLSDELKDISTDIENFSRDYEDTMFGGFSSHLSKLHDRIVNSKSKGDLAESVLDRQHLYKNRTERRDAFKSEQECDDATRNSIAELYKKEMSTHKEILKLRSSFITQEDIKEIEEQNSTLDSDINKHLEKILNTETISNNEKKIRSLKKDLIDVEDTRNKKQQDLVTLDSQIAFHCSEKQAVQTNYQSAQENLKLACSRQTKFFSDTKKIENNIENYKNDIVNTRNNIDRFKKKEDQYDRYYRESQEKYEKSEIALNNVKDNISAYEAEITEIQRNIDKNSLDTKKAENALNDIKNRSSSLHAELTHAQKQIKNLPYEITQVEERIDDQRNTLDKASLVFETAEDEHKKALKEKEGLEALLEAAGNNPLLRGVVTGIVQQVQQNKQHNQ